MNCQVGTLLGRRAAAERSFPCRVHHLKRSLFSTLVAIRVRYVLIDRGAGNTRSIPARIEIFVRSKILVIVTSTIGYYWSVGLVNPFNLCLTRSLRSRCISSVFTQGKHKLQSISHNNRGADWKTQHGVRSSYDDQ